MVMAGLVHQVVPLGELMNAATGWAEPNISASSFSVKSS